MENLIYSMLPIFMSTPVVSEPYLQLHCSLTHKWQLHAKWMRDGFRDWETHLNIVTLQLSRQKYTASLWNIILTCYKSELQELMGILPFTLQGTSSHPCCESFPPLQILPILQALLSSLRWLKYNNDTKSLFTLNIPASRFVILLFPLMCGLCDTWQDMAEIVNSCILVRCVISD